jgi:hypothetical protein
MRETITQRDFAALLQTATTQPERSARHTEPSTTNSLSNQILAMMVPAHDRNRPLDRTLVIEPCASTG